MDGRSRVHEMVDVEAFPPVIYTIAGQFLASGFLFDVSALLGNVKLLHAHPAVKEVRGGD